MSPLTHPFITHRKQRRTKYLYHPLYTHLTYNRKVKKLMYLCVLCGEIDLQITSANFRSMRLKAKAPITNAATAHPESDEKVAVMPQVRDILKLPSRGGSDDEVRLFVAVDKLRQFPFLGVRRRLFRRGGCIDRVFHLLQVRLLPLLPHVVNGCSMFNLQRGKGLCNGG